MLRLATVLAILTTGLASTALPARAATGDPYGNFEAAARTTSGVRVAGWVIDPDTSAPIPVHVYIDDSFAGQIDGSLWRPDVAAAYPSAGGNHGFSAEVAADDNAHTVCVYAINYGTGANNTFLGCRTTPAQPPTVHDPWGNYEALTRGGGSLTVSGWAVDPDQPGTSLPVHVYVDGVKAVEATADRSRPDVAAAYPAYGAAHGYSFTLPDDNNGHSVCVYLINIGPGTTNPFAGCRTVANLNTPVHDPIGAFEAATWTLNGLDISGWTLDPDSGAPIAVDVYVDGVNSGRYSANLDRADIAARYPDFGAAHGFHQTLDIVEGAHQICAYAINVGPGTTNPLLSCISVPAPTATAQGLPLFAVRAGFSEAYGMAVASGVSTVNLRGGNLATTISRPRGLRMDGFQLFETWAVDMVRSPALTTAPIFFNGQYQPEGAWSLTDRTVTSRESVYTYTRGGACSAGTLCRLATFNATDQIVAMGTIKKLTHTFTVCASLRAGRSCVTVSKSVNPAKSPEGSLIAAAWGPTAVG